MMYGKHVSPTSDLNTNTTIPPIESFWVGITKDQCELLTESCSLCTCSFISDGILTQRINGVKSEAGYAELSTLKINSSLK